MKILILLLGLILVLVQLPFGPSLQEQKPEDEKSPVKGWWLVTYFAVPPTQYSKTGGIIKAESLGTRSSLFKEIKEKEKDYSILSWKWKISNTVRSAIETRKDRHDAAARVMVVFGREKSFKLFGREPGGLKIEYIWASHLPKGHVFDHPGEKGCKIFVLESGEGKAGQWISETRNIHNDFKKAFKTDSSGIRAIGIQTDTDHSNERVTAYYSEPTLKKK
ncbi:MAG: hypothetical protein A2157_18970 [Deltaproteobacteria bacterium RBG_16_47_11]|nr:MAG: hypothetical protein A2157_18970 [Deltaproteobacteria bacterium RBG_16_47_11]